jgi:predicted outer membrane repeat protein
LVLAVAVGCTGGVASGPSARQSTTELDFGEIPVLTEASQQVVITNTGSEDFEILSTTVDEAFEDAWRLDRSDDTALAPGETFVATVTFAPSQVGDATSVLEIRTSLSSASNLRIDLIAVAGLSIADEDGDGFSDATGDCDDQEATAFPGAEELCDGIDNDCDGNVPSDESDDDGDGYRICRGDCDDTDALVYPAADEICDDKDTNCSGDIPDREDQDGDGFTLCDGDCDDDEAQSNPGMTEVCDFIDNDCSGLVDDIDADGDGHSACPGGGDCDDENPDAYPVVVDPDAESNGDGSLARPYDSLRLGIQNRDEICGTVILQPGYYELSTTHRSGLLHLIGGGGDPDDVFLSPERSGDRVFDIEDGATLILENLLLTGADTDGDGGVLKAVASDLTLIDVVLIDNRCSGDGGAIAISSGNLSLSHAVFSTNTAEDDGGAVIVLSGVLTDEGSQYDHNSGVRGGAMVLEFTDFVGTDQIFEGNEASHLGGALAITGGTVLLERGQFLSNSAQTSGGAISLTDVSSGGSVLRNLRIQDNVAASEGGGVAISGTRASLVFVNNTLTTNASGDQGAGVFVDANDASGLFVWSNVFLWSDGASALTVGAGSGASVGWNHLYLTTSGADLDIGADEDAGNNVVEDPALTEVTNDGDPDNDDLTPTADSPLIDAGPADGTGPPHYRDWQDPDGSRNDRGYTGGPGAE